eukprot:TRINITY_DN5362_c0_g1::TRINITY_DN5362_c0_g1_i1::g.24154::m.24154 TRINITY_DN5362_c0_g1::TRINITY_DN5362_c0_g1_i1::g.24154  ORF type:complete len:480 (-),score=30.47,sp/Q3E7K8/UBQ12_ARATH/46.00/6e-16,sp/Q3E7K8/UBQ12_ARATH/46.05/8e-14,sp/Q3E7K8/UBQ12_ARATH/42.00/3e-13,ubiquitin/PF00240.18/9.7e+03,ubiquitin/PF00240.18/4e-09,ubiquitin/PF00240.18/4.1e+03,zf-RING_2/PF13639.1/1.6e+02,zf-RING_2/PF13639.1/5.8e-08,Rad60-SLD/PF11976.3/1.1e+02,Rad60-SLD/PF11976.3/3.6e-05,zf-rbx1/PF12678.2/1.3e+03,zf-rbx1/PF126
MADEPEIEINITNDPGCTLKIPVQTKGSKDLKWLRGQILIRLPDVDEIELYWGSSWLNPEQDGTHLDYFDVAPDRPLRVWYSRRLQADGSLIPVNGKQVKVTNETTVADLLNLARTFQDIPDSFEMLFLRTHRGSVMFATEFCQSERAYRNNASYPKKAIHYTTLSALYVSESSKLELFFTPKVDKRIQIFMKTLVGSTYTLLACKTYSTDHLFPQIYHLMGYPRDQCRLIFSGKQMVDGACLAKYGIAEESTIHFTPRLRGGGNCISFVDISDSRVVQQVAFSDQAPAWRIVTPGLNIEGKCNNSSCKAFRNTVICQIGMGDIDIILDTERVRCPCCRQNVTPVTCGFYDCYYRYNGIKILTGDNERSLWSTSARTSSIRKRVTAHSDWLHAQDKDYTYYNPQDSTTDWVHLVISTQAINPDNDCCICYVHSNLTQGFTKVPCCDNVFHVTCLANWTARNPKCPTCRSNLPAQHSSNI